MEESSSATELAVVAVEKTDFVVHTKLVVSIRRPYGPSGFTKQNYFPDNVKSGVEIQHIENDVSRKGSCDRSN